MKTRILVFAIPIILIIGSITFLVKSGYIEEHPTEVLVLNKVHIFSTGKFYLVLKNDDGFVFDMQVGSFYFVNSEINKTITINISKRDINREGIEEFYHNLCILTIVISLIFILIYLIYCITEE